MRSWDDVAEAFLSQRALRSFPAGPESRLAALRGRRACVRCPPRTSQSITCQQARADTGQNADLESNVPERGSGAHGQSVWGPSLRLRLPGPAGDPQHLQLPRRTRPSSHSISLTWGRQLANCPEGLVLHFLRDSAVRVGSRGISVHVLRPWPFHSSPHLLEQAGKSSSPHPGLISLYPRDSHRNLRPGHRGRPDHHQEHTVISQMKRLTLRRAE